MSTIIFLPKLVLGLLLGRSIYIILRFMDNLAAAKRSGIPYLVMPIYTFDRFWLISHRFWLPLIKLLPSAWTERWIGLLTPDFMWEQQHALFRNFGSDILLIVTPSTNTLYVADAEAITQITTRRNDFPKPTWLYVGVDLFGRNLLAAEGALWRCYRKILSPHFTESSNRVVWSESLVQAQLMMTGWLGDDIRRRDTGVIHNLAQESMRLSLHVISSAGFGVSLTWPHQTQREGEIVPQGHTLSFKDALEVILHNLIAVMLLPRWLLRISPFRKQRRQYVALVEWTQYMRDLYLAKKAELACGNRSKGMDMMGALIDSASDHVPEFPKTPNAPQTSPDESTARSLSMDEVFGNMFGLLLAGHETSANTLHFSIVLLAMSISSQRRLQQDLDSILGDRPVSEWDYEHDMPRLLNGMCGAVMNEELRLVPPVVRIPKTTPKDHPQSLVVGGQSFTVPKACFVTLNTTATHRNPRYWPHDSEEDLSKFRPERWLPDNIPSAIKAQEEAVESKSRTQPDMLFRPSKGAYIPFSEGSRSCIGRRFAQTEILAVLAVIFKTWSVELDVSDFLPDVVFTKATVRQQEEAWTKAHNRAQRLFTHGMRSIITLQMREEKVPIRFVKRGAERFAERTRTTA